MEAKKLLTYYRCEECLTTFTSYDKVDVCSCDGPVESLGIVRKDMTVYEEKERCACDARCTNACGPLCNCVCGGVNHGTGKMITVIVEKGKAKVKEVNQEAIDKANDFRKAKQEAWDRYENKYKENIEKEKNREWLDRSVWLEMYNFKKDYKKAIKMKVHGKRMDILNGLLRNYEYHDL